MSEQDNKQVVQAIFESFGRGDIEGVLRHLSEEVVWSAPGSSDVPYYGERRGHKGAAEFFQQLGSNVTFESFEPTVFIAEGDNVVVLGRERGRVNATGKTYDNDWALVFTFLAAKVAYFKLYENTSAVAEAFR
jgi:ketosteroid isomerase-like protein